MSGLFMLGLIAAWLFVGWLIYLIWGVLGFGAQDKLIWKTLHRIMGVGLFSVWFGVAFWAFAGNKMYYDAQVRGLCKKDGGIKVYEEIKLPSDKFNRWEQINFFKPTKGEDALGVEYVYKSKRDRIVSGSQFELSIVRYHDLVYRRSDNKLLGEEIGYWRRGGDLPSFWHPSSYSCPDFDGDNLFKRIFVRIE